MSPKIRNKEFIEECLQGLLDRATGEPGLVCCELVSTEKVHIWDDQENGVYYVAEAFAAVSEVLVGGKQFASSETMAIWANLAGEEIAE